MSQDQPNFRSYYIRDKLFEQTCNRQQKVSDWGWGTTSHKVMRWKTEQILSVDQNFFKSSQPESKRESSVILQRRMKGVEMQSIHYVAMLFSFQFTILHYFLLDCQITSMKLIWTLLQDMLHSSYQENIQGDFHNLDFSSSHELQFWLLYLCFSVLFFFGCCRNIQTSIHLNPCTIYVFFVVPGFHEPSSELSSSVGLSNLAAVILALKGAMTSESLSVQHHAQDCSLHKQWQQL